MDPKELDDVVAQTPATSEPVSQADDVRNDVAEAIKSLKAKSEPIKEDDAPADDHPEPEAKDERPRAADGKFIPKAEAAPKEAAPADTKLPPVDNTAKPSTEQPSTAVVAAPVSWAADAKADWTKASPAIQAAVLKREAEVSSGFKQKSEEVRRYEGMIAPVAQEAARLGMQPDQAINALMSAHHALQRNAPAAIAQLAAQYGVDLATLASNPPATQTQQFDPMVSQLTNHVTRLESQLQGFLQNQTLSVVEQFAQDHPHYAAVENEIAEIIPMVQQANPGLSPSDVLSKAYERAIWLNPDVRSQLIQEHTAPQAKVASLAEKQQKSAKAAVSIKASSNGASAPKVQPVASGGSVYDDVRAAIHQLRQ